MFEGRRAQGRQRVKDMDGFKETTGGEKIDEVVEIAGNRSVWHSIIANVKRHGTAVSKRVTPIIARHTRHE
ncbi:hypothetical protein E2C01_013326 [Portunus trituberculatus]|uniref:Uncharacterized protein n=1 Tax=Portunus trituberculatus TaxID=210409 RepID=A0A5B7DGQ4_PORTR|nr:hypothetical protein [Portunus trituberculatus]